MELFYKSPAHAVDEIGGGWDQSRASHIRRDLPAMISRMRDHMGQDVVLAAAPIFTFTVAIADRFRQISFPARRQVVLPQLR